MIPPADALPPGPNDEDGLVLTFWRLVQPAAWTAQMATDHPHLRGRVEERPAR